MNDDTLKLLRECSSGAKMGAESIGEIIPQIEDGTLRDSLEACRMEHEVLGARVDGMLSASKEEPKEPNLMKKGMSWMTTNVKMSMKPEDSTAAGIITDGCNMGIKSLRRYLNEYPAAQQEAKDAAHDLIRSEENCIDNIKTFL